MAILPGGSCWSFCCCAAVLGVTVLKPEATSMLSLLCVLVCVVAQPTIKANTAMALMILNETCICFIFLVPSRFAVVVVLQMVSSGGENSRGLAPRAHDTATRRPSKGWHACACRVHDAG